MSRTWLAVGFVFTIGGALAFIAFCVLQLMPGSCWGILRLSGYSKPTADPASNEHFQYFGTYTGTHAYWLGALASLATALVGVRILHAESVAMRKAKNIANPLTPASGQSR